MVGACLNERKLAQLRPPAAAVGKAGRPAAASGPTKVCAGCGRRFAWRKAWASCWEQVLYCSAGCRRHRPSAQDLALEAKIVEIATARGLHKTLCPSEAARAIFGDTQGVQAAAMQRTRSAARRLAARGAIEVTQGGQVVDPSSARGPIRLRLRRPPLA